MKNLVVAVDLGTSGCKAIAVDSRGKVVASASQTYSILRPQVGWTQQNPHDWIEAAQTALSEVVLQSKGDRILALGLTGQMHGLCALDEQRRVLRPAILWNDQRTQEQCDKITDLAGGLEGLLRMTGNRMLTGYTAGKLLWMMENEPELFGQMKLFLTPKDYLRLSLTGEIAMDVTDASGTGLFDVAHRCWNQELIALCGFHQDIFAPVVESSEWCGVLTKEAAQRTGLPEKCPVIAGAGDAVLSTLGLGLIRTGQTAVTIGTSGVCATTLENMVDSLTGDLQICCAAQSGRWHAMTAMLSAAGAYRWVQELLLPSQKQAFQAMDHLAQEVPDGADGLYFLPYLAGERCPVFDAKARGGFFGLCDGMGKGHFARAVLEGVAYGMREIYETLSAQCPLDRQQITLAGGGAKSPLWRQILSDVFSLPVVTVRGSEYGAAFGAALLTGAKAGLFDGLDHAVSLLEQKTVEYPDLARAHRYVERYEKYRHLYSSICYLWSERR